MVWATTPAESVVVIQLRTHTLLESFVQTSIAASQNSPDVGVPAAMGSGVVSQTSDTHLPQSVIAAWIGVVIDRAQLVMTETNRFGRNDWLGGGVGLLECFA